MSVIDSNLMNQNQKPTLITLTAPTCAGKSIILSQLLKNGYQRIVSTTTRAQRVNEIEGEDYYFISESESLALEKAGAFAELVTFLGVRYGVTHQEMENKKTGKPSVVILEPGGVAKYEKYCVENGWQIYKVFVEITESVRIERLNQRTASEISKCEPNDSIFCNEIQSIVETHTKRLFSIITEERRWSSMNRWDAVVPGYDVEKAIEMIEFGLSKRNK